jgi:hypothetical protein
MGPKVFAVYVRQLASNIIMPIFSHQKCFHCIQHILFTFCAEPPRINSLKNTQPLPTETYFGPYHYFVADQRGYAVILDPVSSYLTRTNGTISDPRLYLNTVNIINSTVVNFFLDRVHLYALPCYDSKMEMNAQKFVYGKLSPFTCFSDMEV